MDAIGIIGPEDEREGLFWTFEVNTNKERKESKKMRLSGIYPSGLFF
jgi:hypothetical protein